MPVDRRKLKSLRGEMTQPELGEKLGVSATTISQWEKGERNPTIKNLEGVAVYFGIPVAELWDASSGTPTGKFTLRDNHICAAKTLGKIEQACAVIFAELDVNNTIKALHYMEELLEEQKVQEVENVKNKFGGGRINKA